jgi:hypothetical protein
VTTGDGPGDGWPMSAAGRATFALFAVLFALLLASRLVWGW